MPIHKVLSGLLVLSFLVFSGAGCMKIGPDYKRPQTEVYEEWLEAQGVSLRPGQENRSDWWNVFDDPVLSELVKSAFESNLDLRSAGLRVIQGRAQLGIAIGNLYPQTQQASGNYNYTKVSERNPTWPQPAAAKVTNPPYAYWQNTVGLNAAWELDFWGKYRRGIEASDFSMRASAADYDNALVSLAGEVAQTYFGLRISEESLKIARENVELQKQSLTIAQARYRYGATGERDVQQALTLLESTLATIPVIEGDIKKRKHALSVLIGQPPNFKLEELSQSKGIPGPPWEVTVGVPADLLRRRPDVRAAELAAMAQCSQIGVAKADLLPSFSLTGSIGFLASDVGVFKLSELLTQKGFMAGFSPQISWNLFNYGRIINNVRVQDAKFQTLLTTYQQTVLKALREVEDAMTNYLAAIAQVQSLEKAAAAAKRSAELAFIQYSEGKTDYTTVLVAQQEELKQENDLVTARGQVVTSLVGLYRGLGGGWEVREGAPFVPDEVKREMQKRTWWGLEMSEKPEKITDPKSRNIFWYAPDF